MPKKYSIGILLIIFFTIVNIYVIRGSYTLTISGRLDKDNPITMDTDDIVDAAHMDYDNMTDTTIIEFEGISEGTANVTLHRILDDEIDGSSDINTDPTVKLTVDKFFFVYETGFLGSLSNINIIRFEIIFLIILMIINVIFKTKKEKKEARYSYSLMFNVGALVILVINFFLWIYKAFIDRYEGMDKLYSLYGDILTVVTSFAMIIFPFIVLLAIFLIISNIALIRHEGRSLTNMMGILLGLGLIGMTMLSIVPYYVLKALIDVNSYSGFLIMLFFEAAIQSILSYLECMMIGTYICSTFAERHVPRFNKDYIIILGCAIRKDGTVTPLLKGRADRAIWFAKKQKDATGKDITFVASGGKGSDEVTSEAEAIRKYLLENGIDEDHIILEDKSTNTQENMKFSYEKICEDIARKKINSNKNFDSNKNINSNKDNDSDVDTYTANISFSTTGYHVFRSGNIASNLSINATGLGSKTKWYFHTNALIREFVANMNNEKRRHIEKITAMLLLLIMLLIFSYRLNIL